MYLLAIASGGAITHTLVPPTPGPLLMADNLGIDVGVMILVGAVVALPAALAGIIFATVADRAMPVPMRKIGAGPEPEILEDSQLPPLWLALMPVILPVLLISANTVAETLAKQVGAPWINIAEYTQAIGNPNLALLLSTAVALYVLYRQRHPSLAEMSEVIETSLMSGGVIILITAGGGAFGAMLKVAEIGPAIQHLFSGADGASGGFVFLLLGYLVATLLKVAQGSSTVAMITASGMLAAMGASSESLGFHPVYLATAIGAGSLLGSWMNDSGFWIFAKMGGLTEIEALKSWTPLLAVLSAVSLTTTLVLAVVFPMAG